MIPIAIPKTTALNREISKFSSFTCIKGIIARDIERAKKNLNIIGTVLLPMYGRKKSIIETLMKTGIKL
ncbi:hypothetical protein TISLANDTSLP1_02000 [Thermodesulfovibrio yellowstonii]|uniref:Uncharacterized protein n=1 Tax=Thermodesulfovibrio yellowstonii TaxID=28262 RepID=A0A9W6GET8_9BACT|nr:hypothetical protein TISLANDTSLP1_02000 [Thermodesulfovibrio islandicus]